MKKVIINAGHYDQDPGAIAFNTKENEEVCKIRDLLTFMVEENFEVLFVPDEFNLIDSIKWVNERAKNLDDALAVSIHLNAGGGTGAETLYYGTNEKSKAIAKTLLDKYCEITGYNNRGVKSDTTTRFGRLGWIRDTNCWSTLIECCFIDNINDLNFLKANYELVAYGIYLGICDVLEVEPTFKLNKKKEILELLNKLTNLIENL